MIEINPVVRHTPADIEVVRDELRLIRSEVARGYMTPYSALRTFLDEELYKESEAVVAKLKEQNYGLVVLVGIGGSNIGALAIAKALGITTGIELLCVDTIDERYTQELLGQFRNKLNGGVRPIICLITKSGSTPETIINGALCIELLKEYYPADYQNSIVAITDEGSPLDMTARKEGFSVLHIPKEVGGRFSVGTAVGMVPLMLLGIDVQAVRCGAEQALRTSLNDAVEINEAALTALSLYAHYKAGYHIHTLFVFSPALNDLGQWYKQLIGESLGKKDSLNGESLEVGFTPVVSIGTTDLHSVAQLYLAGPRTMITSFLFFEEEKKSLSIPQNSISTLIPGMANRSIAELHSAMVQGTIAAFKKEERPSIVTTLTPTPEAIGSFIINKMIETMVLGRLFNINPFDQPAVELYKQETREILKQTR